MIANLRYLKSQFPLLCQYLKINTAWSWQLALYLRFYLKSVGSNLVLCILVLNYAKVIIRFLTKQILVLSLDNHRTN